MSAEENKEINKAVEELDKLSQDQKNAKDTKNENGA